MGGCDGGEGDLTVGSFGYGPSTGTFGMGGVLSYFVLDLVEDVEFAVFLLGETYFGTGMEEIVTFLRA